LFLNPELSAFGRVALVLFGDAAPKIIAERADCSVRNVNAAISSKSKRKRISAGMLLVIQKEIIG
jgi:hypothetical protein